MNDPELVDEARRWLRFATAVSQARGVYNSIAPSLSGAQPLNKFVERKQSRLQPD